MKALLALQQDDPDWAQVRPPLVALPAARLQELLDECSDLELPAEFGWLRAESGGGANLREGALRR